MTKKQKRRHESGTPEKEDGTTEELKAFIEEKNGEAVAEIKRALDERIAAIEQSLNFAFDSITATSQKANAVEKTLNEMQAEWQSLLGRVAKLEEEKEENEKLRRKTQLIFSGRDLHIPENDRRIIAAMAAMINRMLELEVLPGQIISARRLSRSRVMVTFPGDERGSLREEILRNKYKLRGQQLFINENLTPMRQEAFQILLQARREGKITTVLTRGGEVLFAKSRNERLIRVKNKKEAEHIIAQLAINPPADQVPPGATGPDSASAAGRPQSRDPGQAAGQLTEAGPPARRESVGAGESAPMPPDREGGAAQLAQSQRVSSPRQMELTLSGQPDAAAGPRADRLDGGVTRQDVADLEAVSVAGCGGGGSTASHNAASTPGLESPLQGRPDVDREASQRDADMEVEEHRRQVAADETGEPSGRGGAPALPVQLDAPLPGEQHRSRVGTAVGGAGAGKGLGAGGVRGRVGRTGSAPPGQRDGGSEFTARHLSTTGESKGQEGAHQQRPSTKAATLTGTERREGVKHGELSKKGRPSDIRSYLK